MTEKETAFLGKITAGMTHEFMNVLATIGQTSGLMEDLLVLCRDESFPYQEKFIKILNTIRTQVRRGTEIGTRLKDFAHSMDEIPTHADVDELMEQVVFMMQRFANLKKVKLYFIPLENQFVISVDLFRIEMLIAKCIEKCLERAGEGDTIRLGSEKRSGEIAFLILIEFDSNADNRAIVDEMIDIEETLAILHARIKPLERPSSVGLQLVLPI
ncbi:hypothetical protein ACFL2O_04965 [Thermodesulfobacteriota bacterium]